MPYPRGRDLKPTILIKKTCVFVINIRFGATFVFPAKLSSIISMYVNFNANRLEIGPRANVYSVYCLLSIKSTRMRIFSDKLVFFVVWLLLVKLARIMMLIIKLVFFVIYILCLIIEVTTIYLTLTIIKKKNERLRYTFFLTHVSFFFFGF